MIKSFVNDERGVIMIAFSLVAFGLIAAVGAAVDYSRLVSARTELQVRVDAAALAGAVRAAQAHHLADRDREREAVDAAKGVLAAIAPLSDVSASVAEREVRVAATESLPLVFGRFLGIANTSVAARSVARFDISRTACVLALGPNEPIGIGTGGSSALRADLCTAWSNSTSATSVATSGSSQFRAREICAVGRGGGSGMSPAPRTGCAPLADPFADRVLEAAATCNSPPTMSSGGRHNLLPGSYCGLDLKGEVTLAPGVYTVRNAPLTISGNAVVSGSGVTILLAGSAAIDWSGNPRVRLSPPTSGPTAGLTIAATRDNTATSRFRGTVDADLGGLEDLDGEMSGSIYLPAQRLDFSGNVRFTLNGARDKLVARSIELSGRSRLTVRADDLADLRASPPNVRVTH